MARTLVPDGLRDLLNVKLKDAGWTSVRNFCLSTGLCTPHTYSAETITRIFNARDGETKGSEISTVANVLKFLDVPTAEIREILEHYYPGPQGQMFWSLISAREFDLTALDRLFLDLIQRVATTKPERLPGMIVALEAYTMAADIDCADILSKIKKMMKGR